MELTRVTDVALFVFRPQQVGEILSKIGYEVRNGEVYKSDGARAHFFCCDRPATPEHLGRIMPGSYELICDDPLCLDRYIAASVSE